MGLASPIAESMAAASAWTGYPMSIVSRAKSSGCDAFVRHTVDIQKLVRWVAKAQKSASELPEGFVSWGDVLNQVKSDREKIKLEKDKHTVLDIEVARRSATNAAGYFWNEMERFEREMPGRLKGLTAVEVRKILGTFLGELRARSREKFKAVAERK